MVDLIAHEKCTGCSACYNICPQNAIEMKKDAGGFLYPQIDSAKCISCNLCNTVCPVRKDSISSGLSDLYICQSTDNAILENSASGGVFSEIAKNCIDKEGLVAGALYTDLFKVRHSLCADIDDLEKLKGSKYVQSDLQYIFRDIRECLNRGTKVCFSGTPCQVAGLKSFLRKEYENLLTVDFICHSVGAPRAFSVYLTEKEKKLGKIKKIKFKSKRWGYSFPSLELTYKKNGSMKTVNYTSQEDPYMSLFLSGAISRECCKDCQFRDNHKSDLTLADYYGDTRKFDVLPEKGVCRVYTNTNKGKVALNDVSNNIKTVKPTMGSIIENRDLNVKLAATVPFEDIDNIGEDDFYKKYFKVSLKAKMIGKTRFILYRLGIQNIVKQIVRGHRNKHA